MKPINRNIFHSASVSKINNKHQVGRPPPRIQWKGTGIVLFVFQMFCNEQWIIQHPRQLTCINHNQCCAHGALTYYEETITQHEAAAAHSDNKLCEHPQNRVTEHITSHYITGWYQLGVEGIKTRQVSELNRFAATVKKKKGPQINLPNNPELLQDEPSFFCTSGNLIH